MAIPVEITQRTVTYGPETDFQGNSVTGTLTFTPSADITWVASGQGFHVKPITVSLNSSGSGSVDLICTDQAGFRNALGQTIVNWYYTVTADLVGVAGSTRSFQVPAGSGALDLDTMIPIVGTGGLTVSVPATVSSVAGRTGAVTLTKTDVGLGNVDNTSDAGKPVSTATATALAGKGPALTVAATVTASGALIVNTHNPANATSGNLTMTLPTGQPVGTIVVVEKTDSTANTVTASGNIRGIAASTLVLSLAKESMEFLADAAGSWWPIAGHKTLSSIQTAVTAGVFYPEAYGAVGDNVTDDGPAFSAAIAAASAVGYVGQPGVVRATSGRHYRIKTPIIMQNYVTVDLTGAQLKGPITGYPWIDVADTPTVAGIADVAAQTGGACFADAGDTTIINSPRFIAGRITNFRYGMCSIGAAWSHPVFKNTFFENCNIGFFAYQAAEQPHFEGVASGGSQGGTTFVAAATAFDTTHPYANRDNYYCDGFTYDNNGELNDTGKANAAFDTWFAASILRASISSITVGNPSGYAYVPTGDSLKVTGRNIYIPSRNNRAIFTPTIRKAISKECPLGVALIGNPVNLSISDVSGETLFAAGPKSMFVINVQNGVVPTGTFLNIDGKNTTNAALYTIEVNANVGWAALNAVNIMGTTPFSNVKYFNIPLNVRGPWVTTTYYRVNDVVVSGTIAYRCTTFHQSGASLAGDIANWETWGGTGAAGPPGPTKMLPTGAIAETVSRQAALSTSVALASGQLRLNLLDRPLVTGEVVTSITWLSGATTPAGITNQWAALYDKNRVLLGQSADGTSAWTVGTTKTFTLATPYTATYDGVYYIGIMQAGTTRNSLVGVTSTLGALAIPPIVAGTADSGLTTTAPSTAAVISTGSVVPYGYVS